MSNHEDRFPTDDKWGILNWAKQSNIALWTVVPAARLFMLRDAAFRRWFSYERRWARCDSDAPMSTEVRDWVDYAEWLHKNLALATEGSDDWPELIDRAAAAMLAAGSVR